MKKIVLITGLILFFGTVSCSDDDNATKTSSCDLNTHIDFEEYKNAPSFMLSLIDLEINGDCLKIKFASSGCDGKTWETKLIDSGSIMESLPSQRNLRLTLKNEELCQAMVAKELTFDISNLRVDGNQVYLNISNSNGQSEKILYEY